MTTPPAFKTTQETTTQPPRPRLVLRAGFAGRKDLDSGEETRLRAALHDVFNALGHELVEIAPRVPVSTNRESRIARFFAEQQPLLRLVTGLCEGADLVAWQALETLDIKPDQPSGSATRHLDTELGAVLPFAVETYRTSRPAEVQAEFDRQLAACAWVLELDGLYDKPDADTLSRLPTDDAHRASALANNRRSRGYRAQAAFLLRYSDIVIAAANPAAERKAGGTMDTVREAQVFELPVVFINTHTGAVHLIAPEDDMHAVLANTPQPAAEWQPTLKRWVRQLTIDPDGGQASHAHGEASGEPLLHEFFSQPESPDQDSAKRQRRFRKWIWSAFENRFRSGQKPKSDTPLHPYAVFRDRASKLSGHYGALYRGAFLLNYVLAILAVGLAVTSLVLIALAGHAPAEEPVVRALQATNVASVDSVKIDVHSLVSAYPPPWLIPLLLVMASIKLLIVGSIARNTRRANGDKWNDRAVDFRYLAERLRGMYYLPQVGSQQPPAAEPPQFATRVVRQSAIDWLFDAIVRSISPADLASARKADIPSHDGAGRVPIKKLLQLNPLAGARLVRDHWIREQAVYHDRNARTMHNMDHAIEQSSIALSLIVMVIVAIDIVVAFVEWRHLLPEWGHTLTTVAVALISVSAVFPAIVAALGGIRFQSECRRLAERSGVMRTMLSGWSQHDAHGPGAHHAPAEMQLVGGRFGVADDLARQIEAGAASPATDVGSWSHDVLRMSERVAMDFVQEAAEWSVLYAREVSDPG